MTVKAPQYFTPSPPAGPAAWAKTSASARPVRFRDRAREFRFRTAPGVFAKSGVDRGTRLMLEAVEVGDARRVLDLGCGYGVLGVVLAARAPEARVVLVDVNPRAAALAAENCRLNGVTNAEARCGDGCAPVAGEPFDLIVTNPPIRAGRATVLRLLREAHACLGPGGRLYLVARTSQGARTLGRCMAEVYPHVAEVERGGGFRVYEARAAAPAAGQRPAGPGRLSEPRHV